MPYITNKDFIKSLKFDEKGLIPAVIQDVKNSEVLMVGYMNDEAVKQTLEGPYVTFFSRSKNRLWKKGESSGHTQKVSELFFDCDKDCLLIKVEQNVAACHVGYRSCFYREYKDGEITTIGQKLFDVDKVYE